MTLVDAVSVADDIVKCVADFLAADTTCERGGFLVGQLPSIGNGVTRIDEAIPCPDAPSTAYSLTFRGEEWQLVHGHTAIRDGTAHIVGWFHSHPDISVRMSARDMFIQRHFFAHRGQIAWIRDPIGGDEAFWSLRDDKPVALPRTHESQHGKSGRHD